MKVSRKWIDWAHGPGAEDGQPLAMRLCDLANAPGSGAIEISDPVLIAELVDVAGLYVNASRDDDLYQMGPWWMGQPRKIISEGKALMQRSRPSPSGETAVHRGGGAWIGRRCCPSAGRELVGIHQPEHGMTDKDPSIDSAHAAEERRVAIVQMAKNRHNREGEVEIDDNATLSEGDDNGTYVQAWVWVDFDDTPFDKEPQ